MSKLFPITLAIAVSGVLLAFGATKLSHHSYNEGIKTGITAVIEQCAKEQSTFYNGDTGDVMVCGGGRITQPEKTPGKALTEPPEGTAGSVGHGSIPENMEEQHKPEEI